MELSELKLKKTWTDSSICKQNLQKLDNLKDRRWVMDKCITRVGNNLNETKLIIEYGLAQTEILKDQIPETNDICSLSNEFQYFQQVAWPGELTLEKLIAYRRKLLEIKVKLDLYSKLKLPNKPSYSVAFAKFRNCSKLKIACFTALWGNFKKLSIVFDKFPELLEYLLDILEFFPEGVDLSENKYLFERFMNLGSESIKTSQAPFYNEDWSENVSFHVPSFIYPSENDCPSIGKYRTLIEKLGIEQGLIEWAISKIIAIDNSTGNTKLSLNLVNMLFHDFHISEFDYLHEILVLFNNFALSSFIHFKDIHNALKLENFLKYSISDFIIDLLTDHLNSKINIVSLYIHIATNLVIHFITLNAKLSQLPKTLKLYHLIPNFFTSLPSIFHELSFKLPLNFHGKLLYYIIETAYHNKSEIIMKGGLDVHKLLENVAFNANIPLECILKIAKNFYSNAEIEILELTIPLFEKLHFSLPPSVILRLFNPDVDPKELFYLLHYILNNYYKNIETERRCPLSHKELVTLFSNVFCVFDELCNIFISINNRVCSKSEILPLATLLNLSLKNFDLDLAKSVTDNIICPKSSISLSRKEIIETFLAVIADFTDNSISGNPDDRYMKVSKLYFNLLPQTHAVIVERNLVDAIFTLTCDYKLRLDDSLTSTILSSQIRRMENKTVLLSKLLNSSHTAYLDVNKIVNLSKNLLGIKWDPLEMSRTISIILEAAIHKKDLILATHLLRILIVRCRHYHTDSSTSEVKKYIFSTCKLYNEFSASFDILARRASSSCLFELPFLPKSIIDIL